MKLYNAARSAVLLCGLFLVTPAVGAVILEIERVSDTLGILTGAGSLGATAPSGNAHILSLTNPFGAAPDPDSNNNVLISSTLTVGSVPIITTYDCGTNICPAGSPIIYFGSNFVSFAPGAVLNSGELQLQLQAGDTFASVGTVGSVYWGLHESERQLVGTYAIVAPHAVPVPMVGAGLPGLALAFGGLMIWYRRRRTAQP